MSSFSRSTLHWRVVWLASISLCAVGSIACAIEPDFLIDSDPEFEPPARVKKFTLDYKSIWLAALQRPEVDMQRMAADTIARGHLYGIPNLKETIPTLVTILTNSSAHPESRFAAARALMALEAREASEELWQTSQAQGSDFRQLVEPVLADWDYVPARAIWLKRLETPHTARRELLLAVRGLSRVRDAAALQSVLKLAKDLVQGPDIRLDAASAAGQIADHGLESDAKSLAQESRISATVNKLCAIRFLSHHRSPDSDQLLIELAHDSEHPIAAAALKRLNECDSTLVLPMAEQVINDSDQAVREQGVISLLTSPTTARVTVLGRLLNDPHPEIRTRVCDGLLKLAEKDELRGAILDLATEALAGERWQGQEQASLLLGMLRHQTVANRLVELLESPRPEVMVSSAWALRKLAVADTAAALIDRVRRVASVRGNQGKKEFDEQAAHLLEACGVMRSKEAVPLMTGFIPLGSGLGERSRSAAAWALGWIFEGDVQPQLAQVMIFVISNVTSKPPESVMVKRLCVVALTRMKVKESAEWIRRLTSRGAPPTKLELAYRWALKELTGEEFPEPIPLAVDQGRWFLEPLP